MASITTAITTVPINSITIVRIGTVLSPLAAIAHLASHAGISGGSGCLTTAIIRTVVVVTAIIKSGVITTGVMTVVNIKAIITTTITTKADMAPITTVAIVIIQITPSQQRGCYDPDDHGYGAEQLAGKRSVKLNFKSCWK
ncbi:hypothetical protein CBR_g80 [Chara braunii]|uniref:Uncharacterized protein n=1 Tax=Chara braunii TaxID=69332 RepID=A0A388JLI0_CHABU|nr:hypothetical protein CBR_g80 [Chara braunii]|eukprot:GBG58679.1 hypothetical protein CBR_g80 [Chara braunii]